MTSKGLQVDFIQGALCEGGKSVIGEALTADLCSMQTKLEGLTDKARSDISALAGESTDFLPWFGADFIET